MSHTERPFSYDGEFWFSPFILCRFKKSSHNIVSRPTMMLPLMTDEAEKHNKRHCVPYDARCCCCLSWQVCIVEILLEATVDIKMRNTNLPVVVYQWVLIPVIQPGSGSDWQWDEYWIKGEYIPQVGVANEALPDLRRPQECVGWGAVSKQNRNLQLGTSEQLCFSPAFTVYSPCFMDTFTQNLMPATILWSS